MTKSKKVIIFGCSQTAELANYYLENDSEYNVSGFLVDNKYKKLDTFLKKPVIEMSELVSRYPIHEYLLFAPMTATNMNQDRARIFDDLKSLGYDFISYVSSNATVLTSNIGENCFILENNTVQPFVTIGDNCVLWSGNHIGHHSVIQDNVFFTSHVVLSGNCSVGRNSFFGVNATIRDSAVIAEGTLFGLGAAFSGRRTVPWGIYTGSPAVLNKKRKSHEVM